MLNVFKNCQKLGRTCTLIHYTHNYVHVHVHVVSILPAPECPAKEEGDVISFGFLVL